MSFAKPALLAVAALSIPAMAIAAGPSVYKLRHDNFEAMGLAMKATMDQFKTGNPNMATIRASADALAQAAPKVAHYFPKGSGPEGNKKTEALPAIWQKPAEFAAANQRLVDATKGFQAAAAGGNLDQVKAAFGAVGGSCKNCHDSFRKPHG